MKGAGPARPRPRIESLSDLVFGLALSIGAFALVSSPAMTDAGFYRDVYTFGFNFVVLISIWIRYTRIMSALPVETRGTLFLNATLLFTVALEPYIYNILRTEFSAPATHPTTALFAAASSSFGVDVGAMMVIMGVFTLALADEDKGLVPRAMLGRLQSEAFIWFVAAGIFLASAVPLFGRTSAGSVHLSGYSVRELMWVVGLAVSWVRGTAVESYPPTAPGQEST